MSDHPEKVTRGCHEAIVNCRKDAHLGQEQLPIRLVITLRRGVGRKFHKANRMGRTEVTRESHEAKLGDV